MKKDMVIPFLFLMSLVFGVNCVYAANQSTLEKAEKWVVNLSQEDQRIAILRYQTRLIQKSEEIRAYAKDGTDRLWSKKVLFCGHLLASDFASKNKDQKEAMMFMANALGDVISGKGTVENRKLGLEKAELENQKIAESISDDAADLFRKKHAIDSDEVNKSMLVAAILCASEDNLQKERSTCAPKGTDVCKIARRLADELAPLLPMKLSAQLSLQTVVAVKGHFRMNARLEYGNKYLQTVLINSGVNSDEMINLMHEHAKRGICQPSSPTKEFIDLGGAIGYQYRFNDGTMYTQVSITSCP